MVSSSRETNILWTKLKMSILKLLVPSETLRKLSLLNERRFAYVRRAMERRVMYKDFMSILKLCALYRVVVRSRKLILDLPISSVNFVEGYKGFMREKKSLIEVENNSSYLIVKISAIMDVKKDSIGRPS